MGRPIRVVCMIPISADPTSWYRGVGPLAHLQKATGNAIQYLFIPGNSADWSQLRMGDVLFMQRPCLPEHVNTLILAKDLGMRVIVDYDDDNLAVPEDNPMYQQYAQPVIKDSIVKLARWADALTVATEALKKKYSIYSKNCFVIPNAIDETLLHLRQIPQTPRTKRLLWRGTFTHAENLEVIENEIISLAKRHNDWKFTFFGWKPTRITRHFRNHEPLPFYVPTEYLKQIANIHATALYYSLAQNDHAQSRSHVSWLEASWAGMLTIAPKNEEFTRPGVLNFATPKEFEDHAESVINGQVDIDKHVEESWKEILDKYTLQKVNGIRLSILTQLTGIQIDPRATS